MNADSDATRVVRSWLKEDAHENADRVLDSVLDQLEWIPQRRAGWLARRLRIINSNRFRYGIAAAAIVAAAFLGLRFLPANVGGPPPLATPSPSPETTRLPTGGLLEPGRYHLRVGFPVQITFEVPAGWNACVPSPMEQGLCRGSDEEGITFLIVENVVADPCSEERLDPPVGPSIDDLVAAISGLRGFQATMPTDVTLAGFEGKQFQVTAPGDENCEMRTWATAQRANGVGRGEVNVLRILDVDGVRVMIAAAHFPDHISASELAEMDAIIASIQIE